jgi:hypothetical protein
MISQSLSSIFNQKALPFDRKSNLLMKLNRNEEKEWQ